MLTSVPLNGQESALATPVITYLLTYRQDVAHMYPGEALVCLKQTRTPWSRFITFCYLVEDCRTA